MPEHDPLYVNAELAQGLDNIRLGEIDGEEARAKLVELLQAALQLEFATIPVYLSAAFSLGGENERIRDLVVRVAIEEMLHFTAVANLLIAIGEAPNVEAAVPSYPTDLTILEPPLHLELHSYSDDLVHDLFMRIETPEEPIPFALEDEDPPKTVGLFYDQIIEIIENDLIPGLLDGAAATEGKQITDNLRPSFRSVAYQSNEDTGKYPLPEDIDFFIKDKASAVRHLKWIVDQGEGTSKTDNDPLAESGLPAHYYRFTSILKRKWLIADSAAPKGYSYSGGDLEFDPEDVHEFDANVRSADYADNARVSRHMNRFNTRYSNMISYLIDAFNSQNPTSANEAFEASIREMRPMLGIAGAIVRAAKRSGVKAGVPFEWSP